MNDDRAKPVSAPSRVSSRDDVWKDIRDWAKPSRRTDDDDDEEGGDQGRIIGSQIKDNITEQRLFESRLLDLSKERYKFIVHVAWQRKAFMDKQRYKTSVMKDLLQNVETVDPNSPAVQKGKNQRSRLNEKLETYRDLVRKTYSEQRKKELQTCAPDPEEIKPIIPGTYDDPLYKTEPTFSARSKKRSVFEGGRRRASQNPTMFPAIQPPEKTRQPSVPPNNTRRGTSRGNGTNRLPDAVGMRAGLTTAPGRSSRDNRDNGMLNLSSEHIPRYLKYRSVYDGRFKGLERSLSASYDGKGGPSIENILSGLPRSMSVAL
nr:uncharacterized protein LOC129269471 [Lytechinus pictus]